MEYRDGRTFTVNQKELVELLQKYRDGSASEEEVLLKLREAPYQDLGFAKLDSRRGLQQGVPEIIYGAGKSAEQILGIADAAWKSGQKTILITRISEEKAAYIKEQEPDFPFDYDPVGQTAIGGAIPEPDGLGTIAVVTGGTSDQRVAEEAVRTAEALGNRTERIYDVGVAGLHRLLSSLDPLLGANVVIAIAGMEGALASVVGGLVDVPVIAVPTSIGYGASFHGLSALLSMLNSCASGVSVVNIDNGFGAAYQASMINHPKRHQKNPDNGSDKGEKL